VAKHFLYQCETVTNRWVLIFVTDIVIVPNSVSSKIETCGEVFRTLSTSLTTNAVNFRILSHMLTTSNASRRMRASSISIAIEYPLTFQRYDLIYCIFFNVPTDKPSINTHKKPTRCHLLFYCASYRLNMFLALLCPSSGARDYDVDYHIGRFVLGLLYVGG